MLKKLTFIISTICFLTSCGLTGEEKFYKTREELEAERLGKLTGEGLVVSGGRKSKTTAEGINVNSYLWRAALDTVYKMPITSADPFGGTILTDWYNSSDNERYRVNILIIGTELRSDAIKCSVFKQKKNEMSEWKNIAVSADMASSIEDSILLKAREIRANIK